jgi:hypothetical protein
MNNKPQSHALQNIFKTLSLAKKDLEMINYILTNVKFKDDQECQVFIKKLDEVIEQIDQLADSDIQEVASVEDTL